MRSSKILGIILVVLVLLFFGYRNLKKDTGDVNSYKKIELSYNDIRSAISTTGVVEPQNRLEIKPQVGGRIEEILVREGDHVKKGQIIAWMSSTERAALLDAARNQGKEILQYWQEVYKPTPLISPINGEVIVRALEPGQTINMETPVLVLSDRLIVKAQVDETDIGRVKVGQPVDISLDAYPDNLIQGVVDHIAYESTLVNNVIIYQVDILPIKIPEYFRSGMGANVSIIDREHKNVLTVPLEAITQEKDGSYILLAAENEKEPLKKMVTLGLTDEKRAEIISEINPSAQVLVKVQNYQIPKKKTGGTSPFLPSRRPRS